MPIPLHHRLKELRQPREGMTDNEWRRSMEIEFTSLQLAQNGIKATLARMQEIIYRLDTRGHQE